MPDQPIPNPSPSLIRFAVMVISAITAASTLPWVWMAIGHFGGFAWGMFGFELIVLIGSVVTVLVSLGKVRVGMAFPLAIACLIGTILVGAVFGIHVDARAMVGEDPDLGPWINRTIMFRLSVIALLSMLATLDIYRRDARSWGMVLRATIFLLPVVGALGWIQMRGMPSATDSTGELSMVRMIIILLTGLLIGILLSIGGHFLIRSYEIAVPEPGPEKTDSKPS